MTSYVDFLTTGHGGLLSLEFMKKLDEDFSAITTGAPDRVFDTRAQAAGTAIPAQILSIETNGYTSVGDGGGALYTRSGSPANGAFQSLDGAWWHLFIGLENYPEQLGFIPNNGDPTVAAANLTALNLALSLFPTTRLRAGDYFVSGLVVHQTANHNLIGAGSQYDGAGAATRVIRLDASGDVVRFGLAAYPGSINAMPRGIRCSGISFARAAAPVIASNCRAILAQYMIAGVFSDVRGDESIIAWEFNGVVASYFINCWAERESAGMGGGTDYFWGFYVNGHSAIAAGGNASVYFLTCQSADNRGTKANSVGYKADASFSDTYFLACEATTCAIGMEISGNDSTSQTRGNVDLKIIDFTADSCLVYCLWIHNTDADSAIEIEGFYGAPTAAATNAVLFDTCRGPISISGQLIMQVAASVVAMVCTATQDVDTTGLKILEASSTAFILQNSNGCRINPTVHNPTVSGGAGVQLLGTLANNYIQPTLSGKDNGHSLGIQVVGTGDSNNEYNCSLMRGGSIIGGAASKMNRNGVQITVTGLSGTNLVSGVMT